MRHIKYAPNLSTISEDLTASMIAPKEGPANILMYRKRIVTEEKQTLITSNCRNSHTVANKAVSKSTESNANESIPVVLEPLRQRADTAIAPPSRQSATQNKYGRSIMHDAVRKGDLPLVQTLLATQPALLRLPDKRGNQPLHYAAGTCTPHSEHIMYCLLKAGAFVNATNNRQQTPLLIHVISNESDNDLMTRMLLHHNAKPNIKVTESMLLPQYASSRGLHKVAAALCEFM